MSSIPPSPANSCMNDDNQQTDGVEGESDNGSINSEFDAEIRDLLDSFDSDSDQLEKLLEPLGDDEVTENSDDECESDDSEKTVLLPVERQYGRKPLLNDSHFEVDPEPSIQINTPLSSANLFSRRPAATSSNAPVAESDGSHHDPNPGELVSDSSKCIVSVPVNPCHNCFTAVSDENASGVSLAPSNSVPLVDLEKTQELTGRILQVMNNLKLNCKPVTPDAPQVNEESLPPPPSIGPITTPYFNNSAKEDEAVEKAQSEKTNCRSSAAKNKSSDYEASVNEKPKKPSKHKKTSNDLGKIIVPAVEEFSLNDGASMDRDESSSAADQIDTREDKLGCSHASENSAATSSTSGSVPSLDSDNISEQTVQNLLVVMNQCHKAFQPEDFKKLVEHEEPLLRLVLEIQKKQVIKLDDSSVKRINFFLRHGQKHDYHDEGKKKKKKKKKRKDENKSKTVKSQVIIPNKEARNQFRDTEGNSSSSLSEKSPKKMPGRTVTIETLYLSRNRKSRSKSPSLSPCPSRSKSKSPLSPRNHHTRNRYRISSSRRRSNFHSRHRRSRTRSRSRSVSPFPISKSRHRSRSRSYSRSPVRRSPARNSRRDFHSSKKSPDRSRISRPLRRRSLSPLGPPNKCANRPSSPVSRSTSHSRKSYSKIPFDKLREELRKRNEDAVKNLRKVVEPTSSINQHPSTSGTHDVTVPLNPNASYLPASINDFNVPTRTSVESRCPSFTADVQYSYNQPFPHGRPYEQPQPLYMDPVQRIMHPDNQVPFQNSYITHNPVSELNAFPCSMHHAVQTLSMQTASHHVSELPIQPPPPNYPLPPPPPPPGMSPLISQPLIPNESLYMPNRAYSHEPVPQVVSNCAPQPLLQSISQSVLRVQVAPHPGSHPPQPVPAPVRPTAPQALSSVEPLLPQNANYYDPLAPDEGPAELQVTNNSVSFTEVHMTSTSVSFSQIHLTNENMSFTGDPRSQNSNSYASVDSSTSFAGQPNDLTARRPSINCDGEENLTATPLSVSLSLKPKNLIKINILKNQKLTSGVNNHADSDFIEVLELPPKPPPTVVTLDDEEDKMGDRELSRSQPATSSLVVKSVEDINKSLDTAEKTSQTLKSIATIENRKEVEQMCQKSVKSRVSDNIPLNFNSRSLISSPNRRSPSPLGSSAGSLMSQSKAATPKAMQYRSGKTDFISRNANTSIISKTGNKIQTYAVGPSFSSKKNQHPRKNSNQNEISTTNRSDALICHLPEQSETLNQAKDGPQHKNCIPALLPKKKRRRSQRPSKRQREAWKEEQEKVRLGLEVLYVSSKQVVQSEHVDKNHLPSNKMNSNLPISSTKATSQANNISKRQTHIDLSSKSNRSMQLDKSTINKSDSTSRTDSVSLPHSEEIHTINLLMKQSVSEVTQCSETAVSKALETQSDNVSSLNVSKNLPGTGSSCVSSSAPSDKHCDVQSVNDSCEELSAQGTEVTKGNVPKSSFENKSSEENSPEDSSKSKSKQNCTTSGDNSSDMGCRSSGKNIEKGMSKNVSTVGPVPKKSFQVLANNSKNTNPKKSVEQSENMESTAEISNSSDKRYRGDEDIEEGMNRDKSVSETTNEFPSKPSEFSKDSVIKERAESTLKVKLNTIISHIESVKNLIVLQKTSMPKDLQISSSGKSSEALPSLSSIDSNKESSEPTENELSLPKSSENLVSKESSCVDKEPLNSLKNKISPDKPSTYLLADENSESKVKSVSLIVSEIPVAEKDRYHSKQSKILSKNKTLSSQSFKNVEPQKKVASSKNLVTVKSSHFNKESKNVLKDKTSVPKSFMHLSSQENNNMSKDSKYKSSVSSENPFAMKSSLINEEPKNFHKDKSFVSKSFKDSPDQENTSLSKESKKSHKSFPAGSKDSAVLESNQVDKEHKDSYNCKTSLFTSSKDLSSLETTNLCIESKNPVRDTQTPPLSCDGLVSIDSCCAKNEANDSNKNKVCSHRSFNDPLVQGNIDLTKKSKNKVSLAVSSETSSSVESSNVSDEPKGSQKERTFLHKSNKDSPFQEITNLSTGSKESSKAKSPLQTPSEGSVAVRSSCIIKEPKDSSKETTSLHKSSKYSPAQEYTNLSKDSEDSYKDKSSLSVSSEGSFSAKSCYVSKAFKDQPKDKITSPKSSKNFRTQQNPEFRKESIDSHKSKSLPTLSEGSVAIRSSHGSKETKDSYQEKISPLKSFKNSPAHKNIDLSEKFKDFHKDKSNAPVSLKSSVLVDSHCVGKEPKDLQKDETFSHKSSKDFLTQENTESHKESKNLHEDNSTLAATSRVLAATNSSHVIEEPKDSIQEKTSTRKSFKNSSVQKNMDSSKESKDFHEAKSPPPVSSEDLIAAESSQVSKKTRCSFKNPDSQHKSSKDSVAQETTDSSKESRNSWEKKVITSGSSVIRGSSLVSEKESDCRVINIPERLVSMVSLSTDSKICSDDSKKPKISSKNETSVSKLAKDTEPQKIADFNEDSSRLQTDKISSSKAVSKVTQENDSINEKSMSLLKDKDLPRNSNPNSVPQESTDMSKKSNILLKEKPSSPKPLKVSVDFKAPGPGDQKKNSATENCRKDKSNSEFLKIKIPPGVCLQKQLVVNLKRLCLSDLGMRDRRSMIRKLRANKKSFEAIKDVGKERSLLLQDSDVNEISSSKTLEVAKVKRRLSELHSDPDKIPDDVTSKVSVKYGFAESESNLNETTVKEASKIQCQKFDASDSNVTGNKKAPQKSVKHHSSELNINLDETSICKTSKSAVQCHLSVLDSDSDEVRSNKKSTMLPAHDFELDVPPHEEPIKPAIKRCAFRIESDSDDTPNNSPTKLVPLKRCVFLPLSNSDEESKKSSETPSQRSIAEVSIDSKDTSGSKTITVPKRRLSESSKCSDKTNTNAHKRKKSDHSTLKTKKEEEEVRLNLLQGQLLQNKPKLGSFRIPKISSKSKLSSGILNANDEDDQRSILNDRNVNTILSFDRPKENVHKPVLQGLRHRLFNCVDDLSNKSVSPDLSAVANGNPIKGRRFSVDKQLKENQFIEKKDKLLLKKFTDETIVPVKSPVKENILYPIENSRGTDKPVSHGEEPLLKEASEVISEIITGILNRESEESESNKIFEHDPTKVLQNNEQSIPHGGELPLKENSEVISKIISKSPSRENGNPALTEIAKTSAVDDEKLTSDTEFLPVKEMNNVAPSLAEETVSSNTSVTVCKKTVDGLIEKTTDEVEFLIKNKEVSFTSKLPRRTSLASRIARQIKRKKKIKLRQKLQWKKKISSLEHKNLYLKAQVVYHKCNAKDFKKLYTDLKKENQKRKFLNKFVQCCISDGGDSSSSSATASSKSSPSSSQNLALGTPGKKAKLASKSDEGLSYKAKRGKKLWTYLQSQNAKKTVSCQTTGPKLDCKLINTNSATLVSASELNISYVASALLSYQQEAPDK